MLRRDGDERRQEAQVACRRIARRRLVRDELLRQRRARLRARRCATSAPDMHRDAANTIRVAACISRVNSGSTPWRRSASCTGGRCTMSGVLPRGVRSRRVAISTVDVDVAAGFARAHWRAASRHRRSQKASRRAARRCAPGRGPPAPPGCAARSDVVAGCTPMPVRRTPAGHTMSSCWRPSTPSKVRRPSASSSSSRSPQFAGSRTRSPVR